MKPYGRSEMQSWLGILKEQVTIHAKRNAEGAAGSLTVEQAGWMKMVLKDKSLDRKFVVLVTEQKEVAEAMTVTHTLYWFESEESSKDLMSNKGALDLEEVEDIETVGGKSLKLMTEAGWPLELTPEAQHTLDEWKLGFRHTCVNADGYEAPEEAAPVPTGASKGSDSVIFRDPFKIAVPKDGGKGTLWVGYVCELLEDGTFVYSLEDPASKDDLPSDWAGGRIDVKRAIGVWLLGQSGFRHLDIILPGKKVRHTRALTAQTPHPPLRPPASLGHQLMRPPAAHSLRSARTKRQLSTDGRKHCWSKCRTGPSRRCIVVGWRRRVRRAPAARGTGRCDTLFCSRAGSYFTSRMRARQSARAQSISSQHSACR